jgi:hypothetical protein
VRVYLSWDEVSVELEAEGEYDPMVMADLVNQARDLYERLVGTDVLAAGADEE